MQSPDNKTQGCSAALRAVISAPTHLWVQTPLCLTGVSPAAHNQKHLRAELAALTFLEAN